MKNLLPSPQGISAGGSLIVRFGGRKCPTKLTLLNQRVDQPVRMRFTGSCTSNSGSNLESHGRYFCAGKNVFLFSIFL